MVDAAVPLLATSFRFHVSLRRATGPEGTPERIGDGSFQECSGLDVELEISEYLEGGRNDALIQRPGRVRHPRLVLKRGMFHGDGGTVDDGTWSWIQSIVRGTRPVPRYNGTVEVMTARQEVVASWDFDRALPAKVVGPQLNAKTGEVAIEELHLAHEGLRLVTR